MNKKIQTGIKQTTKKFVTKDEAAKLLHISVKNIELLEKQELLHALPQKEGYDLFLASDIARIQSNQGLSLAQEAEQIEVQLQREIASSLSFVKKALLMAAGGITTYYLVVVMVAFLFIFFPLPTATWLGYLPRIQSSLSSQSTNLHGNVLAAQTNRESQNASLLVKMVLKPVSKTSLDIVKYTNPKAYATVKKIAILDVNEVMELNDTGAITPLEPVKFSQSALLQIADPGLITNLNSQYLQGKKPGIDVGDIAVIGENGIIEGRQATTTDKNTNVTIGGLTNTNLANASVTITTSSPLSGGGTVALGDTITLSCPSCSTSSVASNTISSLSSTNFSSANISQWANNTGFITASTTDTLTNKTITAASNTVSGLTNANLSGTAGITNANLANSSLTISTGTGLSGGGIVSLGGTISLTNTGVTALTGTTNQISVSGSTGSLTLALPQSIAISSTPSFASLALSNSSNQLVLGGNGTLTWSPSTNRTLTFPDITDTLVGKTTTDTLTNKTVTAPAINGIVTTTGLTFPAFTASGTITGSGSPSITGFGAINGLTFSPGADGFSIAGGTTTRTLTMTETDITLGSTIKPTNSGGLTIQSNGANTLSLDTGSAATLTLGTTNANGINLCNATQNTTVTLNGTGLTTLGGNLTINGTTQTLGNGLNATIQTTANAGLTFLSAGSGTITLGQNSGTGNIIIQPNAGGKAALILNNQGNGDLFTASASGITKFQIVANGNISALGTLSGLTGHTVTAGAVSFPAGSIANSNLANASIIVSTGVGLSGGTTVALGESVCLINTGVTSLTGTAAQINVSGATSAVTLSLPQNIAATSSPSFASLNLTNTANQLVLGTTNLGTITWTPSITRTLTFPDATDTVIGKATTDILTNKTLTAPTINGTVTTTGLTLPAFTASGNITGSGLPTMTNFGALNGLTLTSASDGFTIAGGTTTRTLTLTNADITLGSTIKPTSSGPLTIQSNGAHQIVLDAGGSAILYIGTTSASAIAIGRSGTTTTISATASANNLIIGAGATITKHLSATATFDAANIALGSCGNIGTVTVTGVVVGDTVVATPTAVSGGIETLLVNWNAYVSNANTVTIRACSVATIGGQDAANQTWRADVWQH